MGPRKAGRRCAPYKRFAKQNLGARRNSLSPRRLNALGSPQNYDFVGRTRLRQV